MPNLGRTLFSLFAANAEAQRVIHYEQNAHLRSIYDGVFALDIGRHLAKTSNGFILATIGRGEDAGIFIPDRDISKRHCSFELDNKRNAVMVYDRSSTRSCQTFREDAIIFEDCRHPRRIAILLGLNTTIRMGGLEKNRILFHLHWSCEVEHVSRVLQDRGEFETDPRSARTLRIPLDTIVPSMLQTRPSTPGAIQLQLRFKIQGDPLGEGSFGKVYKAIDPNSGRFIAVKLLRKRTGSIKNEVGHLSRLNHEHIVRLFASSENSICMELMEGSLASLVECGVFEKEALADIVFEHTLRGLKRLAEASIIHRDIKPDNILYSMRNKAYMFKIADFGLANYKVLAETLVGTKLYLAPEIVTEGAKQAHKIDVWSFYVTIIWSLNICEFRSAVDCKRFRTSKDIRRAIEATRSDVTVQAIQRMAEVNPDKRPSATDMLDIVVQYRRKTDSADPSTAPEALSVPMKKRPLRGSKGEKNRVNRRRRQAPRVIGDRLAICIPGAFPVEMGK